MRWWMHWSFATTYSADLLVHEIHKPYFCFTGAVYADAICEAVPRATLQFVAVKSKEQQAFI
jgi:nitrogenase molybdenum-iron protein alpha/beta subunit